MEEKNVMARCAHNDCGKWRPDMLVRFGGAGLFVDDAWFCSAACVAGATRHRLRDVGQPFARVPAIPALRLGVLLLHQGAITSAELTNALSEQKITGRRLGAQLQVMGLANSESVLRGLSAQAGVSYLAAVDPACVRHAPGGLSGDEVRALGVVPIQVDVLSHIVVVACQAPLRRAALSALRQLTGLAPEPLLVSDEDWQSLVGNYGTAVVTGRQVEFVRVRDRDDAATRVAAAAARERTVTLTEARCGSSTWVKVEGPDAINTLLMHYDREDVWPAATTSH
jgi:hypothetical protein